MFCKCGTIVRIPEMGNQVLCRTCGRQTKAAFLETVFEKRFFQDATAPLCESTAPTIKHTCPGCGAGEMRYRSVQTRSADEGQTIFYTCDCGYRAKTDT